MPRTSASLASIIPLEVPGQRPLPPEDLGDDQAAEWNKFVNAMPVGWFPEDSWHLLAQLCRHVCVARILGQLLSHLTKKGLLDDSRAKLALIKAHNEEGQVILKISSKLRLTLHSRYNAVAAQRRIKRAGPSSQAASPWDV